MMGLSLYANHEINHPLVSKAICFAFVCIVLNTNTVKLNLHSRETIRLTAAKKWCFFSMSKKCFLIRLTANERSKQTIENRAKVSKLEKSLACFQHYFVYNSYTRE